METTDRIGSAKAAYGAARGRRCALVHAGRERSRQFSWERTVELHQKSGKEWM